MELPKDSKQIVLVADVRIAEQLEKACHNYMIATVPGYCAERWAHVYLNKKTNEAAFYTDNRVEKVLNKQIADSRVDKISDDFKTLEAIKIEEDAAKEAQIGPVGSEVTPKVP